MIFVGSDYLEEIDAFGQVVTWTRKGNASTNGIRRDTKALRMIPETASIK